MKVVITELLGLNNSQGPAGELSKAAIAAIQEAVSAKQDVRVITAKGNNVTNIGFFKERLDKYNEDEMNIDDVIISITEQQGKVRAETMRANGTNPGQAQPAILITEDRNMRVKANARGVPAIAGSALRAIVAPRGDKDMSRSRSKRKSFATPLATPKQRFSDVPRSEAAGDVEAATYHITQSGGGRQPQPQSPNFKKRHKRDKDMARGGGLG